uniref:element excision factor XisI family protein n=1 Tax=Candidatus Electrothrix sp. TaxID=2170559 RepID=UPI004056E5B7
MENDIKLYQAGIKKLLSEYKALQTEWSEVELLFDDEHRHYMAYRVGWFRHRRIHFCLVHIDIVGDTVIIQANNTEDMIDEELIRLGIPQDRIRLGLLPPDLPVPPEEPDRVHPLH